MSVILEIYKCCCLLCRNEYSIKGFGSHYWRKHGAGKSHDPNKIRNVVYERVCCIHCHIETNFRSIKEHTDKCKLNPINYKLCKQCNSIITSKHSKIFCSGSCSAIYSNARKDYTNIKTGPTPKPKYTNIEWKICPVTNKLYCNKNNKGNIRKRSPYYKPKKESYKGNPLLYEYRQKCLFKFNVYDYPTEYNTKLVEDVGWYKPSNRGNNLNGVSRDHMLSVKYGFDNNIDPDIISHPANCQLIVQSDNASKSSKSNITLKELLVSIEVWNKKYII